MKKFLTLMTAAVLLFGCVNITAYADDAHKGTTTITATVAAVAYEIVIPENVSMTEPGVVEIGAPSVTNIQNANAKIVISYTAEGTDFALTGGSETMTATYYSDAEGKTVFPATAVEVYKNKALVDPLPKIYVGVSEDDWYTATPGTYTATVTFDFNSSFNSKKTISDILNTVSGGFPTNREDGWRGLNGMDHLSVYLDGSTFKNDNLSGGYNTNISSFDISGEATLDGNVYVYEEKQQYYSYFWKFIMTDNVLTSIERAKDDFSITFVKQ